MTPSRRLLWLLLAWAVAALPLALLARPSPLGDPCRWVWWALGAALLAAAMIDALRRGGAERLTLSRRLPESLAMAAANPAELRLFNPGRIPLRIEVVEDHPSAIEVQGLPASLSLPAGAGATLRYLLLPRQRGEASLGATWLRIESRWGLWRFQRRGGEPVRVRVYPNFTAAQQFGQLAPGRQSRELGIHLQQRRGEGLEFLQLRPFRAGDALRQVDWKSSGRYRKPISREYQDERDQTVIFLLDCGRRMRTRDDDQNHFDHALNALLLTAQVALQQGDAVGLLTFADKSGERWVPPVKGRTAIHQLTQRVYDLHSSTATSDYLQAAERLLQRQRRHALVVLVSNVRTEDTDDLRAAARLLSRHHQVLLANLRECYLDKRLSQSVTNFNDALTLAGTVAHLEERRRLLQRLVLERLAVVDSTPDRLRAALVQHYLLLKRSGRL